MRRFILKKFFSIKNTDKHKIINITGIKIKFKRKINPVFLNNEIYINNERMYDICAKSNIKLNINGCNNIIKFASFVGGGEFCVLI